MPRGIRTHDPRVLASEESSCLRPHGHCDRPQEPTAGPYPEPDESSSYHPILFSLQNIVVNYYE
jgi:hypothetical protein